ncbi:MAG: hypothetical protein A3J01_02675 [Candidatus Yanofskybacteria bacterium RIFCSPLOWO2_02_FULL_45_18]|uniref:Predicted 3'-5' exonuclease PolB-like domain-containing protein n=1 Tax=Candidatus Yanofskybacteria bacterium RIFCSPLOWO2_02_FULL_45_18 TaxID=1802707 RepID=A0A1F8H4J3_9BACT|nr:MAG: hypothetical protein A3J01_02675 [Candidatus Yanofskybacteria bacterium RIFCSPLOWO2_02_FULL_45_18]
MATKLVFDIETVGVEFDSLDKMSQESLLKYAQTPEEEEEIKEHLSFSPLTGEIIAIGILNPDTDKGAVYFQAPGQNLEKTETEDVQYIPATEKEILQNFWEIITHYDQFVTFNGRTFDCPYIVVRSGILKIKPTANLMPNRYYDQHIDLLDRLTFFGAVRQRMNLHMWCRAFGITSPKSKGVTGDDVGQLFKDKEYLDIARYCFDDIKATKELFEYWEKYINVK